MDNTSKEKAAKLAVEEYFIDRGYVRTFIYENDKTPVWDGNFFIYSHESIFNNSTLLYKIPIQLKGHKIDSCDFPDFTSHRLSRMTIQQYLRDGGILFIKVLLSGRDRKIYANFLSKHKLEHCLKTMTGKTHSVKLKLLCDDIAPFLEEAEAFQLQRTRTPVTPFDIKNVPVSIRCSARPLAGENVCEYIVRNKRRLLVKVNDSGPELYLECDECRIHTRSKERTPVYVEGVQFYSELTRSYEEDGSQKIYIGKSLSIKIKPKQEGNFTVQFNLALGDIDTPDAMINELRFLNALGKSKSIAIGSRTIDLQQIDSSDPTFVQWRQALKFWEDAHMLFNTLCVYEPLHITGLTDKDYSNLNKLVQTILYNKTMTTTEPHDHLELIKIGNLDIVLLVKMTEGKNCKFMSLQNNSMIRVSAKRNGVSYPLPVLSKILREPELQSNICFDNIVETYESFSGKNPYIAEVANEDALCLLSHYEKKKIPILIENALKLSGWILRFANDRETKDMYMLNHLQAKILSNGMTEHDKSVLYDISDTSENIVHKWKASVLLGDLGRAERYWHRIPDSDRKVLAGYPVCLLIPDGERRRLGIGNEDADAGPWSIPDQA